MPVRFLHLEDAHHRGGALMSKLRLGFMAATALGAIMSVASAADMPVRPIYKAPPPPPAAFSWTGFYIGGIAGGSWSTTEAAITGIHVAEIPNTNFDGFDATGFSIPVAQTQSNGFLAGGTVGYNVQVAPWLVLGV